MTTAKSKFGVYGPSVILFLGLVAVYALFFPRRDWNSASRLLLTYAIVQQGTFEITDFVSESGHLLSDPQTRDLSNAKDGKYYCDKAPGHSIMGVLPAWLAIRVFGLPPHPLRASVMETFLTDRVLIAGTNGVLTALTAVLLFSTLLRKQTSAFIAMATALAFGLGTIALPYATVYYGHSSSGFFCMLSFWLFFTGTETNSKAFLGGLAAGCAVVCEYTLVVFPCVVSFTIAMNSLGDSRGENSRRRLFVFLLGGVLPAAGLMAYHHAVTGSAFLFPYQFEVEKSFEYHAKGVPIGTPNPEWIAELIWGNRRGIVWFSPVVLGAIPGAWLLFHRREKTSLFVCAGTFLALLIMIAGFPSWHGGWSTGPRFLLPAIPLLMVMTGQWLAASSSQSWIGFCNAALKWMWVGGFVLGCAIVVSCTVVGPQIHQDIPQPLSQFVWPALDEPPATKLEVGFLQRVPKAPFDVRLFRKPSTGVRQPFTQATEDWLSLMGVEQQTRVPATLFALGIIAAFSIAVLFASRKIMDKKGL